MAHLVTSAPLRAGHTPVSGQLCEAAAEGSSPAPQFPVTFRPTGIRLLTIRSRRRSWASLAVGLPGRTRTSTGFSRSARSETRPARAPPVPRAHGVLTAATSSPVAFAPPLRQPLSPTAPPHLLAPPPPT